MAKVGRGGTISTLDPVTYDQRIYYASLAAGAPFAYAVVPGTLRSIEIYPSPDGVYTVSVAYHTRFPDLVNDTDSNYLTDMFPEVLIAYAVQKGLEWLGDIESAGRWSQVVQNELVRMMKHETEGTLSASFDTIQVIGRQRAQQ
jgi:hypothetical protein